MKNRIKYLALFTIMFIFSACSGLFEFKPYFTTFVYDHRIYGIIENGKINRMGISREKVNKMNHIISNKYGIKFSSKNRIYANEDSQTYYNIKFYNDLKFILNGKEYIIPKEKIVRKEIDQGDIWIEYSYPAPVDITKTNDDSYILEIGEIEILDKNGKVIKAKEKIPPLVFKKTYYRVLIKSYGGSEDIYYDGWAEDYPKDPSTLKKIY
ncbi:hypothetical protein [Fusobacterium pseudoperiodonticum]|uniref:hypothetical protein n=1 Tax=Fusobacterium pseudoperiodonticum TaxID=2663009 RepID=UPI001D17A29D|nr:hypothetical protein [Fusobacterium pseudoperiodonticum]